MAGAWRLIETFGFDGQRVAYDVMGDGPLMVLVDGTPFSSFVWRRIARDLARRHRRFAHQALD